jgi:hypothetical protein
MANTKITDLASLTAASGDELPINRAGTDGKITLPLVAAGGGSNPLTSGTFSTAATVDFVLTSYTAFRGLKFLITNLTVSDDSARIWLRTSTDGGSSYSAGVADYGSC